MDQDLTARRILRRDQVSELTGLARATIYAKVAAGTFPRPIRLGSRSVGWRLSDIDEWIAAPERRWDPDAVR